MEKEKIDKRYTYKVDLMHNDECIESFDFTYYDNPLTMRELTKIITAEIRKKVSFKIQLTETIIQNIVTRPVAAQEAPETQEDDSVSDEDFMFQDTHF